MILRIDLSHDSGVLLSIFLFIPVDIRVVLLKVNQNMSDVFLCLFSVCESAVRTLTHYSLTLPARITCLMLSIFQLQSYLYVVHPLPVFFCLAVLSH